MKDDKPSSPIKFAKVTAKEALSDVNERLTLIFATMIYVFAAIATFIIVAAVADSVALTSDPLFWELIRRLYAPAFILLFVIFTGPLFTGYHRMAAKVAGGEHIGLAELFRYYSSFGLFMKSCCVALLSALPLAPAAIAAELTPLLGDGITGILLAMAVAVAAVILCIILLVSVLPLASIFVLSHDRNPFKCFARSIRLAFKHFPQTVLLILGSLPWVLLSLCTVGVLFMIFTLHYITVTEICYTDQILFSTEEKQK